MVTVQKTRGGDFGRMSLPTAWKENYGIYVLILWIVRVVEIDEVILKEVIIWISRRLNLPIINNLIIRKIVGETTYF